MHDSSTKAFWFTVFVASVLLSAGAEVRPFDLYQPIIDRAPFGQPPPDFDPTLSPSARQPSSASAEDAAAPVDVQQEELKKSISATALVIDASRTVWVGFTDASDPKSPRNHYTPVGTSEDGWLVKSADPEKRTVVFVKNDIEVELVVGETGAKPVSNEKGAVASGRHVGIPVSSPRSSLLNHNAAEGSGGMRSMRSLRQQRLAREAERDRQLVEDRKAREAAAEEARLQREEEARLREQERAEADAEREEMKEKLKNLAADIEQRMAERRAGRDDDGPGGEEGD